MKQFDELRKIDTSIIDNGNFDRELMALTGKIRDGAKDARQHEGHTRDDNETIRAFDLWVPVYADCVKLDRDFYRHGSLNWAKKKQRWDKWKERLWGVVVGGLLTGLVTSWLYDFGKSKVVDWQQNHLSPAVTKSATRP